jgi:hypothetical protein
VATSTGRAELEVFSKDPQRASKGSGGVNGIQMTGCPWPLKPIREGLRRLQGAWAAEEFGVPFFARVMPAPNKHYQSKCDDQKYHDDHGAH